MAIGDLFSVEGVDGLHYLDTGMYDTPEYGAVYFVDGDAPAVVDTGIGTRVENILDALDELGIGREGLATIAVTHVHLDHAGGAGHLVRECPNATVYTHRIGAPHLVDPSRLVAGTKQAVGDQWQYYRDPVPVPEDRLVAIEDGDTIPFGDDDLLTHHAPGHAPHHVVFEWAAREVVFCADAAGIYVPAIDAIEPTSPPSNFDLEQCLDDVELLRDIAPETLCYTHYGPADAAGKLDEYAAVLPAWVAEVREVREELGDDAAVVEHFADTIADRMGHVWPEEKAREEGKLNTRGVLGYLDHRGE